MWHGNVRRHHLLKAANLIASLGLTTASSPDERRRSPGPTDAMRDRSRMTRRMISLGGFLAVVLSLQLGLIQGSARAAPLIPGGLNPGDTYQLVFVTQGGTHGAGNLAFYDAFVQTQASIAGSLTSAYGATWGAIAAIFDPIDNNIILNAGVAGPVYRLDGTQVATNSADFWDGSLLSAISLDQFGATTSAGVWTGVQDATGSVNVTSLLFSSSAPAFGLSSSPGSTWAFISNTSNATLNRVYGISEVLTVPVAETPIPAALPLFASGLGVLVFLARRRRKAIAAA